MLRRPSLFVLIVVLSAGAQTPESVSAPRQAQIQERLETYLRNLFAWGPTFELKLDSLRSSELPGFYQVSVRVSTGSQSETGVVYVSKDGTYLIRGDIYNLTADPFAAARKHMHIQGNPSKGPPNARVTVVEFSDFECPHCRELYKALKGLEHRYPQVQFVFKDYPLTQIHPWAMTAALAARCAYLHSSDAFWSVHDSIFESQGLINPDNAYSKIKEFTAQAGLAEEDFRACMISPEPKHAVVANIADAQALKVTSTPTVFVNGRPLVGGSPEILEQYINYELAASDPTSSPRP